MPPRTVSFLGVLTSGLLACGGGGGSDDGSGGGSGEGSTSVIADTTAGPGESGADETAGGPVPLPARFAVTADFLAGTLSLVDLDALASGATTREAVVVGTIDLSAYPPGPLQVEIAPDRTTAVVAVGPGFFGGLVGTAIGAGPIPDGGTLLLVDLVTQSVTAELDPAHAPMGIAIAPDGSRAYTANYGTEAVVGDTMSIVDLSTGTIVDDVVIGGRPEQVALDDAGALGIVNIASDGTLRVFETADPAGTLSTPLPVSGDPSDVAFIAGTSRAIVASSLDPSTYQIVDVSDPSAPALLESAPEPGGVPYPATAIPGTTEAIVVATDFAKVIAVRVDVATDPSTVVWRHEVSGLQAFPLATAIDPVGGTILVDAPGPNHLVVLGLDGAQSRTIPWQDATGPTYVAVAP